MEQRLDHLGQDLIQQVLNVQLSSLRHHFTGTWARSENNVPHAELISHLSAQQREHLAKLIREVANIVLTATAMWLDYQLHTGAIAATVETTTKEQVDLSEFDLEILIGQWIEQFADQTVPKVS